MNLKVHAGLLRSESTRNTLANNSGARYAAVITPGRRPSCQNPTLPNQDARRPYGAPKPEQCPGSYRRNDVLVYVHGYYTSFVTAVETALALKRGLQFPGPVVVYSWPSRKTSALAYRTDEDNAEWSMPHFIKFLGNINKAFPGMPVSLAGYSLGSRFVTDGIAFFRREGCNNCFGRAVLFAPDVFTADLRSALTASNLCSGKPLTNPSASAPVLLYVSNNDRALRQSETFHGNQRAGQAGGDLILCSGVDTVDVSYLKSGGKSGHGYLLDPRVLQDAAAAFAGAPPTSPKRGLKQVSRTGGVYYELLPSP